MLHFKQTAMHYGDSSHCSPTTLSFWQPRKICPRILQFCFQTTQINQAFTCHISKMSSKISSAIEVISRASRYLPVVQRKMLYNAMVLPYFNYCSITWATADQNHLDVLERFQKRAGRIVLGVPSRTNTREVYHKLKWTNLRTKWKINRCLMVHKCLNSNVPEYLCNHFTRSDHKHSTRMSTPGSVNIPALRTVQGQRSF